MKKPFFNKVPQGKPFTHKGLEYYHLLPFWKRPLYALVKVVQYTLCFFGYHWHDFLTDECCLHLKCCKRPKYGKAFYKTSIPDTF